MRYDVAVVGGGPAGLSAAIQARSRNKSVLVVSAPVADIPLSRSPRVDNYPGLPHVSGRELLEIFGRQAEELGVERKTGRVLNIMPLGETFYLGIGSDVAEARAVVLATGAVQQAKSPGEARLLGRGVSYCATCDGMLYRGKAVAVVGRTAQAPAEANYLQSIGCQVTYVAARRPDELDGAIPFVQAAGPVEVLGETAVTGLRAGESLLPCDGVFLLRSAMALSDLMPGLAEEGGYLAVDRGQRTNLPGVFAAGDCTGKPLQVSKAVGEGLVAGQNAADYVDEHNRKKG